MKCYTVAPASAATANTRKPTVRANAPGFATSRAGVMTGEFFDYEMVERSSTTHASDQCLEQSLRSIARTLRDLVELTMRFTRSRLTYQWRRGRAPFELAQVGLQTWSSEQDNARFLKGKRTAPRMLVQSSVLDSLRTTEITVHCTQTRSQDFHVWSAGLYDLSKRLDH